MRKTGTYNKKLLSSSFSLLINKPQVQQKDTTKVSVTFDVSKYKAQKFHQKYILNTVVAVIGIFTTVIIVIIILINSPPIWAEFRCLWPQSRTLRVE